MTATKKQPPTAELLSARSHWVELSSSGPIEKEEVFLRFATEWRGTPVVAEVSCDRYSHGMSRESQRLGDWRVITRKVSERTDDEWRLGPECTDTARSRVSEWVNPLAEAWLASPAYRVSEAAAYGYAIERELREARPSFDNPTERTRSKLTRFADKLDAETYDRLLRACNAFDEFAAIFRGEA